MIFFRIIFLSFVIWGFGFIYFIMQISTYENSSNLEADAIIVLTGAKGRIDAGLELLHQKKANHLFISGVAQNAAVEDLSRYLQSFPSNQMNKLKSQIILGHFANSTEENAIESFTWIQKNNFKTIILVTSDYHLPRSLYLFKRLMPNIKIIPYQSSNNFNYRTIFLEYNKFLLAMLK